MTGPTNLRRLTEKGIAAFDDYLSRLKNEPALPIPEYLLTDPAASEPIPREICVEPQIFPTRLAAAAYLHALLADTGLPDVNRDPGLWTWLTLFYFDQLCPSVKGKRKPGERARYIPNFSDNRRYYRHLLFGPYAVYRIQHRNADSLNVLLSSAMTVATSETFRSFVENSEILTAECALRVANRLYYDAETSSMRRGSGGKENGGCRRFLDYMQQINLTYDLQLIDDETLLQMLPREFDRFRNA
jgi:hypothetical protein